MVRPIAKTQVLAIWANRLENIINDLQVERDLLADFAKAYLLKRDFAACEKLGEGILLFLEQPGKPARTEPRYTPEFKLMAVWSYHKARPKNRAALLRQLNVPRRTIEQWQSAHRRGTLGHQKASKRVRQLEQDWPEVSPEEYQRAQSNFLALLAKERSQTHAELKALRERAKTQYNALPTRRLPLRENAREPDISPNGFAHVESKVLIPDLE